MSVIWNQKPSPIFDKVVASYYPAVSNLASRFTDNPRQAIALTREAFNSARKLPVCGRSSITIIAQLFEIVTPSHNI